MKENKMLLRYVKILILCGIGLTILPSIFISVIVLIMSKGFIMLSILQIALIYICNVVIYLISGSIAWVICERYKQSNYLFTIILTWLIYYVLFSVLAYCADTYSSWWPLAVIGCFIASFLPQIVLIPFINKWLVKQKSTTL